MNGGSLIDYFVVYLETQMNHLHVIIINLNYLVIVTATMNMCFLEAFSAKLLFVPYKVCQTAKYGFTYSTFI